MFGRDELRDDEIRPCPSHGDAKRIDDLRKRRREEHLVEDRPAGRTQGVGHAQHLIGHAMRDVHHHQDQLEEHADPDDRDLFVLPEPLQQDEKRNERGGGHVANGVDRRVEERAHDLERPHQEPEGHRHHRREQKPRDDPEGAPAHVVVKGEVHHHVPPGQHHLVGARDEEWVLHKCGEERPDANDEDEAAHRQDRPGPPRDGLLRSEIGTDEAPAPPRADRRRRRSYSGRRDPAQLRSSTTS